MGKATTLPKRNFTQDVIHKFETKIGIDWIVPDWKTTRKDTIDRAGISTKGKISCNFHSFARNASKESDRACYSSER